MRLPILLALLLTAAPANANTLVRSAETFCTSLQTLNRKGYSTRPGSTAATVIAQKANVTTSSYREHWELARTLVPWCRTVW